MPLKHITPVILSGGSGKRLWPLSNEKTPKQFLDLGFDKNLFQMTLDRIEHCKFGAPILIACSKHKQLIEYNIQDRQYNGRTIYEPLQRNTAPATTAAALSVDKDSVLLIMPSDHLIKDLDVFVNSIEQSIGYANKGHIVTFGAPPTSGHTGYGYIERGNPLTNEIYKVVKFHEKPDQTTAEKYVNSLNYYWNSGIFCFTAATWLRELEKHYPDLLLNVGRAIENSHKDNDRILLDQMSYEKCENISIDHAIMEKTDKAIVIPFDAGWSDIGNWNSLWEKSSKDKSGNVIQGNVNIHSGTENIIISKNKPIQILGADNLIIVETDEGILVANKDMAEDIKNLI